ncbi:MAG: hypothetical protein M1825_000467 [Sarcosagium campestre]|nr:MAG: hypothetical protein M1825_000467 [Sarcosagium campestre]
MSPNTSSFHSRPDGPSRASTSTRHSDPQGPEGQQLPSSLSLHQHSPQPMARPAHQRFVFSDPIAFRYLEEDPSTIVLERRRRLEGYEIYIVEQWACSRVHPTCVITTYTGDRAHSVVVGVLSVPTDEDSWSPRLRVYFKAVSQFHARRKETQLGTLMVTNLSSFPSALTVIAVTSGDVRKHREDFIQNENLKRLGCAGRAGLSLAPPAAATQAKFHQLYRTSDRIPLFGAVIELVKLCQIALYLFDKLPAAYADGLLCDVTERAINDWWTEFGTDFYNVEPSDGILGPTTVAGLLGMLMGARNRLNAYGSPVGKDVFDVPTFKQGIAYFQKSQKLRSSRRLDRQTFDRLHRVTAKAASGEGWAVPKAVKSTVAELSGKGGEMVMGMVGGRDKAGIAEVETLDIGRLVELVHGNRPKWLWYGRPKKNTAKEPQERLAGDGGLVFGKDESGGYVWSSRRGSSLDKDDFQDDRREAEQSLGAPTRRGDEQATTGETHTEKEQVSKRAMLKASTGRKMDPRSGFERIKEAVGMTRHHSHHNKSSREENVFVDAAERLPSRSDPVERRPAISSSNSYQTIDDPRMDIASAEYGEPKPTTAKLEQLRREKEAEDAKQGHGSGGIPSVSPFASQTSLPVSTENSVNAEEYHESRLLGEGANKDRRASDDPLDPTEPAAKPFLEASVFDNDPALHGDDGRSRSPGDPKWLLRRSQSFPRLQRVDIVESQRWPRQLSFSSAEEAVLGWTTVIENGFTKNSGNEANDSVRFQHENVQANVAKHMEEELLKVDDEVGEWVWDQLHKVQALTDLASRNEEELSGIYYGRLRDYEDVRADSNGLLADERTHISDAVREVEVLSAKLEYEINALAAKVEDVEEGVEGFEKLVLDLEARAQELEAEEKKEPESWLHRMMSLVGMLRR